MAGAVALPAPERGAEVRRLREGLAALWRLVLLPRSVRDIEDAGPEQEATTLPHPPAAAGLTAEEARRLREMDERIERIRRQHQELLRLYERRRPGPGGPDQGGSE